MWILCPNRFRPQWELTLTDGRFVFTQDQETPRVAVIATATNAVVRSISLPRIAFYSIVTKDGHLLLANSESGKLFVVDLASGAVAMPIIQRYKDDNEWERRLGSIFGVAGGLPRE